MENSDRLDGGLFDGKTDENSGKGREVKLEKCKILSAQFWRQFCL